jgi:cob(I)alamin adenosyltransferase
MSKKSKVYTKSGDKGETSLVGGQRIEKSDRRIDLYGDVDELNSHIGLAVSFLNENKNTAKYSVEINILIDIQALLFDLGSNLACEANQREEFKLPQLQKKSIKQLEDEMDRMDTHCKELKTFVLPGGTKEAAALHICRTVCRRVERKLIGQSKELGTTGLPENSVEFINRLSDYFFVLSRYVNTLENQNEILWKPQKI